MQASKIMIGKVYAIKADRGEGLKRFNIVSVTTVRSRSTGSPHDYSSYVSGTVLNDDGHPVGDVIKIDPEKVLGPFEDYAELVAQKKAQDAAREAATKAVNDRADKLRLTLYALVDQEAPPGNDRYNYSQPFRASSGSLEISQQGVQWLLEALEKSKT